MDGGCLKSAVGQLSGLAWLGWLSVGTRVLEQNGQLSDSSESNSVSDPCRANMAPEPNEGE